MKGLQQQLYLRGVGLDYLDFRGCKLQVDESIRLGVLQACGIDVEDQQLIEQSNYNLDVQPWLQPLANCQFSTEQRSSFKLKLDPQQIQQQIHWQIRSEEKLLVSGIESACTLQETGNYYHLGTAYSEREVRLPKLRFGYYQLSVTLAQQTYAGELIVSPQFAYSAVEEKCWGLSVQLYSIKSADNLGMGDFYDLQQLVLHSAAQGAQYILLNPLHALFDHQPERASPYSPSDRSCLNPYYIHPFTCIDYQRSAAAQDFAESEFLRATLEREKAQTYIDYSLVYALKLEIFIGMYEAFKSRELTTNSERAEEFLGFCKSHPQLDQYSRWQQSLTDQNNYLQDSCFVSYLQWIAHQQLLHCQSQCKKSGMTIGLVFDLAVGCASDGSETSNNQQLFVNRASIGAPADGWAKSGQNWGLPPIDPVKLKAQNYGHFRDLLNINMRHCGALRLDHIISLAQLWWCLPNQKNHPNGCYVHYPLEQLMAILKLESQLNRCAIIAEDLGNVPAELSDAILNGRIYSSILLYFYRDQQGQFIDSEFLGERCFIMIANHDVATFKAWWQGDDLLLSQQLELAQPEMLQGAQAARLREKTELLSWLQRHQHPRLMDSPSFSVYTAVATVLALSKAQLLTLQLDDLDDNALPVNIPGTDQQYLNWRRRYNKGLTEIFGDNNFFTTINNARQA